MASEPVEALPIDKLGLVEASTLDEGEGHIEDQVDLPPQSTSVELSDEEKSKQVLGVGYYQIADIQAQIDNLYQRVNTNYLTLVEIIKRVNQVTLQGGLQPHNSDSSLAGPSTSTDLVLSAGYVTEDTMDKVVHVLSEEVLQLQSNTESHRMQAMRERETLEKRILDLTAMATSSKKHMRTDGKFRWRIEQMMSKFGLHRSTTDPEKMSITSEHFQTPSGHEFRLRLFMNGSGRGKNTCMSLFIQMCRTEFDDTLMYPFNGIVTLRMLDLAQGRPKKHWEQRFKTNSSACFQKPEGAYCPENGLAQFITHEMLFKNNGFTDDGVSPVFMKNDVLYIGVDINSTDPK